MECASLLALLARPGLKARLSSAALTTSEALPQTNHYQGSHNHGLHGIHGKGKACLGLGR